MAIEIGTHVRTPWEFDGVVIALDLATESAKVLMEEYQPDEDSDIEAQGFSDWFYFDELEELSD